MEGYSDKVLENFRNPMNVGEIEDADGVGRVGSSVCGDVMELYLRIEEDKITDAKFKTFGCAAAIASGSVLTQLVKGKSIQEALKISNQVVAEALGGLPQVKMHCSLLAEEALKKAINDYIEHKLQKT